MYSAIAYIEPTSTENVLRNNKLLYMPSNLVFCQQREISYRYNVDKLGNNPRELVKTEKSPAKLHRFD